MKINSFPKKNFCFQKNHCPAISSTLSYLGIKVDAHLSGQNDGGYQCRAVASPAGYISLWASEQTFNQKTEGGESSVNYFEFVKLI